MGDSDTARHPIRVCLTRIPGAELQTRLNQFFFFFQQNICLAIFISALIVVCFFISVFDVYYIPVR